NSGISLPSPDLCNSASATYPPFEYLNSDNQIVGFDINLAKALCAEMKAKCSFTNNPFDSLVPALKFRRHNAVIQVHHAPGRRGEVHSQCAEKLGRVLGRGVNLEGW
ncbi:bacterial extracellular solute-binding, 3 family protein, partial [Candidatus Erwinia dacicola]